MSQRPSRKRRRSSCALKDEVFDFNVPTNSTLYITNLPSVTTTASLRQLFKVRGQSTGGATGFHLTDAAVHTRAYRGGEREREIERTARLSSLER